jgi:hypothetical protein
MRFDLCRPAPFCEDAFLTGDTGQWKLLLMDLVDEKG